MITNLAGLKALPPKEADKAWPVHVQAVILTTNGSWFLQDPSGAVYVSGAKDKSLDLRRGDLVDVEGFSLSGGFSPVLTGDPVDKTNVAEVTMRLLARDQLPKPRTPSIEELLWGKDDCALVEVEGVVRRILPKKSAEEHSTEFPLDVGGVLVLVDVNEVGAREKLEALVDARVRVRGVLATTINDNRQLLRNLLHLNSVADLDVIRQPQATAFELPFSTPTDLFGFYNKNPGHQLRMKGTVWWHDPAVGLRLRVKKENVFVRVVMTNRLSTGTVVDVAGYAARGAMSPILEDCLIRVARPGLEHGPFVYKPDEFPKTDFQSTLWSSDEGELIQVSVHLEEYARTQKGVSLIVSHGNQSLMAELQLERDEPLPRIRRGSDLRLTGVFALNTSDEPGTASAKLLLRSPADILVVSQPSWLTPEKITGVLFGSVAVGLIVSYWVTVLRRKNQLLSKTLVEKEQAKLELQEAHDSLEQRVAERTAELEKARVAAEAASRSKGMFVANMSHEIRTPMNGVIGFTHLLLESGLNEDQQEMAERIRQSSDAMMRLINDILDFSKIESGKMTCDCVAFDLVETLESALDSVAERAHRKGLELSFFVPPELPRILMGDPGRIRQIILNLLSNALKFTEQGDVSLEIKPVGRKGAENELRFEVRDSGIGISEEAQSRLFQAFEQADGSTTRKYGGTGLGLAISKRLTELMGGRMGVDSREGEGSVFWFTLKLVDADANNHEGFVPDPGLKGLRALVADDNATVRRHLSSLLTAYGMQVSEAANDGEAMGLLTRAAESGHPFQFLLVERALPESGGLDLSLEVRHNPALAQIQIVLLSSLFGSQSRAAVLEADIKLQVTKPVRPSQLYQILTQAVSVEAQDRKAAASAIGTTIDPSQSTPQTALNILLAEDNPVNQALARKQLKKLGHSVEVAANGLQVLDLLDKGRFDVVLMDCQMPQLDGYETTMRIRRGAEETRDIPIIAMTANAMEGDREKCLGAGMNDYVTKPVRIEELKSALDRIGDRQT